MLCRDGCLALVCPAPNFARILNPKILSKCANHSGFFGASGFACFAPSSSQPKCAKHCVFTADCFKYVELSLMFSMCIHISYCFDMSCQFGGISKTWYIFDPKHIVAKSGSQTAHSIGKTHVKRTGFELNSGMLNLLGPKCQRQWQ